MSTVYEIPLSAPPQTFSVKLAGVSYRMRVTWQEATNGGWILDIADASGNDLVCGVPLVTGVDLLGQYAHLGIGGSLAVATDGDPAAAPTYANLGSTSHLYFVVS